MPATSYAVPASHSLCVHDLLFLTGAALATALATGLGAIPVFLLGPRAEAIRPGLLGFAAGSMTVASVMGLIVPGLRSGSIDVAVGMFVGVLLLLGVRRWMKARPVTSATVDAIGQRRSALVFLVLFVHSLPEGLALGAAFASDDAGIGVFVFLAIALQNIPEGTGIAIPMAQAGYRPRAQFWAAVGTSIPQPIGALIAFGLAESIDGVLPASFGFAAGAMLALVAIELIPGAFTSPNRSQPTAGLLIGAAVMYLLGVWIAV